MDEVIHALLMVKHARVELAVPQRLAGPRRGALLPRFGTVARGGDEHGYTDAYLRLGNVLHAQDKPEAAIEP